jgi:hypothetical protein
MVRRRGGLPPSGANGRWRHDFLARRHGDGMNSALNFNALAETLDVTRNSVGKQAAKPGPP